MSKLSISDPPIVNNPKFYRIVKEISFIIYIMKNAVRFTFLPALSHQTRKNTLIIYIRINSYLE